MWWPGTLLGAGAGFAVASIPGALLGGLLGQVLDRRWRVQGWGDLRERLAGRSRLQDDELLFVLLGRLAKQDGRVGEVHIRQARDEMARLGLDEPGRQRAIAAFNRGKAGKDRLNHHLRHLSSQAHAAEGTVRACWRMVWADGQAGERERALLLNWGGTLGLSLAQVRALGRDYQPRTVTPTPAAGVEYRAALRLLGVAETASAQQVKHAYRRLLSQHHPDKLTGSGASEAQVRQATERTRELHQAYAVVKSRQAH
ncbi:DnaJ domain-containing protein [Pseudomonas entomophila]|uniref:DnaJ domain-containing protein n=1 Tax=Pseudomonas entomophila TaxID=312306 RepID=UPI003EB6A20D